jgi:molybdate transport system substrate-binding protein
MRKKSIIALLILSLFLVWGCGQSSPEQQEAQVELNVAAAASLQDAVQEVAATYKESHPEVNIVFNFASSGALQKQIEEGAPADLFLSAGKKQMDSLAEQDVIVSESRRDFLLNQLVLITGKDSSLSDFDDLLDEEVKNIGIGEPETVPAGKYAKEALTSLGIYEKLQPKIVMGKDVRQVLTYVETGNADAGLVYLSDTYGAENSKVAVVAPEGSHSPIVYPLAVLKASENQEAAQEFADYLSGSEAAAIFEKYLFVIPE